MPLNLRLFILIVGIITPLINVGITYLLPFNNQLYYVIAALWILFYLCFLMRKLALGLKQSINNSKDLEHIKFNTEVLIILVNGLITLMFDESHMLVILTFSVESALLPIFMDHYLSE
ncbi:hypothetical protein ACYATP_08160 [Lactobacillaceae bacterium Melli_B4]